MTKESRDLEQSLRCTNLLFVRSALSSYDIAVVVCPTVKSIHRRMSGRKANPSFCPNIPRDRNKLFCSSKKPSPSSRHKFFWAPRPKTT
ncbi:hypothetical protein MCOR03_004405 [Pyricularia oryzae]|nr:hypothetical protein MCOR21_004270 [Pyricularia oryzae]KAI6440968.1 hypothetical protein MCOR22_006835 [Pyricularia oryzae]KAI6496146.1 hypothetical protein MCOR11_005000 [Pyricularia oryzae]KAI6560286.1 hypothetical protein MCOR03_004405 [Pyricularia oryzae]KAI6598485.1 hypothetical protein MCOR12_005357 [Pyricularia oryzae]